MPEVPALSLVEWVSIAGGLFAVGYGAGIARAWLRRIVSVS